MTQPTNRWASETWNGVETRYEVTDALHDEKTPFQSMEFVRTKLYGKMLLLDGIVQTTERDEFIYHEMMTHVPMLAHPIPRRVLIIGGGDGGILREALKHPDVETATMVEIDQRVVEFSKEHLPMLSAGAFDDPRAELVIDDGARFVRETNRTFDVIIVDSPDPVGPAETLFSKRFYEDVRARFADANSVMVRQTGSTFMQAEEQAQAWERTEGLFARRALYAYTVPTYVGGLFSTIFCSAGLDPLGAGREDLERRSALLNLEAGYYTPGVHAGAFELPPYVQGNVQHDA